MGDDSQDREEMSKCMECCPASIHMVCLEREKLGVLNWWKFYVKLESSFCL